MPKPIELEEDLRARIAAFQWLFDSLGDGVVAVDASGRIVLANAAAERILGKRPVEADLALWPGRPLARALGGESCSAESSEFGVTASPLRDDSGGVRGAIAILRDAGEGARLLAAEREARRAAEAIISEHRAAQERLTALVDASGVLLGSLQLSGMLPVVLDLARKMLPADAYAIWRQDRASGHWRLACASGLSEAYQNACSEAAVDFAMPDSPLVLADVETAPLVGARRELYRAEGIRSILAVPMRIHGVNTGSITFYSRSPRRFDEAEIGAACALSNLAAAAIGSAELYEDQMRMRAEAEQAERQAAFLAEATTILGSTLDYETTLGQVAQLAVPQVADWCVVWFREADGSIRQLAAAHANPFKAEWAKEASRRYPLDPDAPRGVAKVLREGRPELVAEIADAMLAEAARDAEHLRILRSAGFKSYMCVPMSARGRTLGAIAFVSTESGRSYGAADLALAEHLGRRAGLAVDNALLFASAQSERQAAETSLEASRRSEARFKRLLESGIIGIFLGEDDAIMEANDLFLEMVGYSREHLGNLCRKDITSPDCLEADARAWREMLERGAFTPFETEYLRQDGGRVPALVGGAMIEGALRPAWVCFALDLTERTRLEQRLRESQKLESIGLLAGGVAHDFNNLLTGIMGNASLALDDMPAESPLRPLIENVVRASERAAHLTRQLLAYSGRGRFVIQPVNLSELVSDISSLLQMSIPKKVKLRLDLMDGIPPVEADSSQLHQLIMNLVLNGAEAIGESVGTVLVATGVEELDRAFIETSLLRVDMAPGAYVYLEVHDSGCGMDEETKSRIFDPFFTTKFTGRGLGLAAALGIVRGHKGDIKVHSSPGRGSTFRVLLPAISMRVAGRAPTLPLREDLRGSGVVLVVDDEEVVVRAAQAALDRYGYEVLAARDGSEAVEVYREAAARVSVVLLDVAMPMMNGDEALARLREIRPDVPVIVSSGFSEAEAARRFEGAGVAAFIQKPFRSVQLAQTIKSVLEGQRRGLASGGAG